MVLVSISETYIEDSYVLFFSAADTIWTLISWCTLDAHRVQINFTLNFISGGFISTVIGWHDIDRNIVQGNSVFIFFRNHSSVSACLELKIFFNVWFNSKSFFCEKYSMDVLNLNLIEVPVAIFRNTVNGSYYKEVFVFEFVLTLLVLPHWTFNNFFLIYALDIWNDIIFA